MPEKPLADINQRIKALEEIKSYLESSELHRRIIMMHVLLPTLSKTKLAQQMGIGVDEVFSAFKSKAYKDVVNATAEQDILELTLFATTTLRDLMRAGDTMVRYRAAVAVLQNQGVMSLPGTPSAKTPPVILVQGFWNHEPQKVIDADS